MRDISNDGGIEANLESVFNKNAMKYLTSFTGEIEQGVVDSISKRRVEFYAFAQPAHILQIHQPRKAENTTEEKNAK